ncbi:MAG: hypothetical protein ACT4NL_08670 [Pseudomarimonas sp.]
MKQPHENVPLKQAVLELFEGEHLDAEQLRGLRAASGQPASPQRRHWLAAAAAVVAVSGLGLVLTRRGSDAEHLTMLAEEVAYTHLTYSAAAGVALDAVGNTIAVLRPHFDGVGFALIDASGDAALQGAALEGGRACILTAAPAVQLRYRGVLGEISVCQTRFNPLRHRDVPDLAGTAATPIVLHARGVRVSLAHQQGVMFAVAVAA